MIPLQASATESNLLRQASCRHDRRSIRTALHRRPCRRRHSGEPRYYEDAITHRADRRWIVADEIVAAVAQPIRTETQADGRIRHWAYIPRLRAYFRIVTLADGQTVHNVFKDRDFVDG